MAESEDSHSFVRITNREIYEMLVQVRDRTTAVENLVGNVLGENVDLRKRVRALELKTYTLLSGCVTAIALVLKVGIL